ncbi:hypothetical protein EYR41_001803 [Orbilia oligospora]|uniref:Uncharacterized protein n=1 Tax=Orbilia oligospora TaxID=2813651 RepID=A0A7C8KBR4_ORBOL|nr:hypothetical protein TWF751_008079 [Orbilia oligospora]TGJ74845.1 hypothetical protein EYR41_001803 [Orbilia oligospora]
MGIMRYILLLRRPFSSHFHSVSTPSSLLFLSITYLFIHIKFPPPFYPAVSQTINSSPNNHLSVLDYFSNLLLMVKVVSGSCSTRWRLHLMASSILSYSMPPHEAGVSMPGFYG